MNLKECLIEAMAQLNEEHVIRYTEEMLAAGEDYPTIQSCLNTGITQVGNLFENGEYFIADLIVSGMIYRNALSVISPYSSSLKALPIGRVVIGVVEGDIHDIGKDIIVSLLRSERFEVIDLGIDVKPERFVYAVKTYLPDVLLMSGVITPAQNAMARTMQALNADPQCSHVPVLVGGLCVNEHLKQSIGADGWAYDAFTTVDFCKKVIGAKHEHNK